MRVHCACWCRLGLFSSPGRLRSHNDTFLIILEVENSQHWENRILKLTLPFLEPCTLRSTVLGQLDPVGGTVRKWTTDRMCRPLLAPHHSWPSIIWRSQSPRASCRSPLVNGFPSHSWCDDHPCRGTGVVYHDLVTFWKWNCGNRLTFIGGKPARSWPFTCQSKAGEA